MQSNKQIKPIKQILTEARALIEKGWTQGKLAKNVWGHQVRYDDPDACAFCSLGALRKAVHKINPDLYPKLRHQLALAIGEDPSAGSEYYQVVRFNDAPGRTQAEVLAMFDKAINECD